VQHWPSMMIDTVPGCVLSVRGIWLYVRDRALPRELPESNRPFVNKPAPSMALAQIASTSIPRSPMAC
jgi:hypothetical protein